MNAWYSFLDRSDYKGSEPYFFDTAQFAWAKNVEANWTTIRSELDKLLATDATMNPYFDPNLVTKAQSWKTIAFGAWGVWFGQNCRKVPKTIALLQKIPGCVSASFNLLDPHSSIKPHNGDTNAIVRCHLGLHIPAGLPQVGFRVGNEERAWENGKLLIFCDAHRHTAWNESDQKRYILLFDVVRPEYIQQKKRVCSRVLASLFLQSAVSKLPTPIGTLLTKLPMLLQFLLFKMAEYSARVLVPIRNSFVGLYSAGD